MSSVMSVSSVCAVMRLVPGLKALPSTGGYLEQWQRQVGSPHGPPHMQELSRMCIDFYHLCEQQRCTRGAGVLRGLHAKRPAARQRSGGSLTCCK